MFSTYVPHGSKGQTSASTDRAIRHALATVLVAALISPLGIAALLHGRAVSERIVQRDQENFSSFRTASSEAGR